MKIDNKSSSSFLVNERKKALKRNFLLEFHYVGPKMTKITFFTFEEFARKWTVLSRNFQAKTDDQNEGGYIGLVE